MPPLRSLRRLGRRAQSCKSLAGRGARGLRLDRLIEARSLFVERPLDPHVRRAQRSHYAIQPRMNSSVCRSRIARMRPRSKDDAPIDPSHFGARREAPESSCLVRMPCAFERPPSSARPGTSCTSARSSCRCAAALHSRRTRSRIVSCSRGPIRSCPSGTRRSSPPAGRRP